MSQDMLIPCLIDFEETINLGFISYRFSLRIFCLLKKIYFIYLGPILINLFLSLCKHLIQFLNIIISLSM
jgi:hypothetical protein